MKRQDGFTLIELLVVVAIIGILASMAVTGLMRSRSAANEASAISSIRTVTSGEVAYSSSCGSGGYAVTLPTLTTYISPELAAAAIVLKSGYRIQLTPSATAVNGATDCNGLATQTGFYVGAEPATFGSTGHRAFASSSSNSAIWQTYAAVAPVEPFAAPAMPLR